MKRFLLFSAILLASCSSVSQGLNEEELIGNVKSSKQTYYSVTIADGVATKGEVNRVKVYSYDEKGNKTEFVDDYESFTDTIKYIYDERRNCVKEHTASTSKGRRKLTCGQVTYYSYTASNQLDGYQRFDDNGIKTHYLHSNIHQGNVIESTEYFYWFSTTKNRKYTYDDLNNIVMEEYSEDGSVPRKHIVQMKYDENGKMTEKSRRRWGYNTIEGFDIEENISIESWVYSDNEQPVEYKRLYTFKTTKEPKLEESTIYTYNDKNLLTKVMTTKGGDEESSITSEYTYDKNGNWITKSTIDSADESDNEIVEREITYY